MATEKENIIEMIKNLPDDVSMEDIIEAIYVRKKIEKLNFAQVKTIENIYREWRVGKHTLPEVSGVMHTGWLTFARKIL